MQSEIDYRLSLDDSLNLSRGEINSLPSFLLEKRMINIDVDAIANVVDEAKSQLREVRSVHREAEDKVNAVSYTHLTLPTILLV